MYYIAILMYCCVPSDNMQWPVIVLIAVFYKSLFANDYIISYINERKTRHGKGSMLHNEVCLAKNSQVTSNIQLECLILE